LKPEVQKEQEPGSIRKRSLGKRDKIQLHHRFGKRQTVVMHKHKNKLHMILFLGTKSRSLKVTRTILVSLKC